MKLSPELEAAYKVQLDQEANLYLRDRKEILTQIADLAIDPIGRNPLHPEKRIAQTTSRLAALLVNLGNNADAQFEESMKVQKRLINLTWALIALTVGLLMFTVVLALK